MGAQHSTVVDCNSDVKSDQKLTRGYHQKMVAAGAVNDRDPRSPTLGVRRTPLKFLTFAGKHSAVSPSAFVDPRSPTVGVKRTPIRQAVLRARLARLVPEEVSDLSVLNTPSPRRGSIPSVALETQLTPSASSPSRLSFSSAGKDRDTPCSDAISAMRAHLTTASRPPSPCPVNGPRMKIKSARISVVVNENDVENNSQHVSPAKFASPVPKRVSGNQSGAPRSGEKLPQLVRQRSALSISNEVV